MSDSFKYTKNMIEWRRNMVVSYLAKGWSQQDIAKELKIHPSTISLDVQFLKEQAKKQLETHISDRLPFEYARAMEGINNVLKRVSEISDTAADNKIKMECLKLQMELYKSLVSMATDGGIIERAMKMVRVISPLPGEDIPAESQEEKEQQQNDGEDIITEDEDVSTETEDIAEEE
jgi:transcriptional regulator